MRVRLTVVALILFAFAGLCIEAQGQSSPVQIPGRFSTGNTASMNGLIQPSWPPNSMSAKMRLWEALLDVAYPKQFNEETSALELIRQLNEIGLPIVIDQSAKDDSLEIDEPIELQLPAAPLRARLTQALSEKNATIVFRRDYIAIISLDDADDSEHFMTLVYDVSDLQTDPIRLAQTIINTIDIDSWLETGQGLGTFEISTVNGRQLFSISQTYVIHRDIQHLLSGFHELGGLSPQTSYRLRRPTVFAANSIAGARSVFVPSSLQVQPGHSSGTSRGNLFGGGGGGVFNVSERDRKPENSR